MSAETRFGPWLKRRRRALGITQEALAERLEYSLETVQKLEAGKRRPSKRLAGLLADSLELSADDRPAFIRFARSTPGLADVRLAIPGSGHVQEGDLSSSANNLPVPLTPLLGRERELAALHELLSREQVRLLTLAGPPGIGKTRLGLQAAANLLGHVADGVCFVALAPISDPDLVVSTIALTLGLKETAELPLEDSLKQFLRAKRLLLLLDNFEQVLDATPAILNVLEACSGLKVLITSREALHVPGEQQFQVPPLALPETTDLVTADALMRVPAVALLVASAQAARPDFALSDENAAAVAAVCLRLDGLPLALELAAAYLRLFSPQELLERLLRRLGAVTVGARFLPPRQRTLRGAIAWSYDLLDAPEQALFAQLG